VGGGCGEECGKEKSVADQFAVKYRIETYYWTKKLDKEDYGVDKYLCIP
jgi:hypothetical protein